MTDYTTQINEWYQAVQFRDAPAAELAAFNAALNAGATFEQVQNDIIDSAWTQTFVNPAIREYQAAFGRVPDQAGLAFWVGQLSAQGSSVLSQMSTLFANSPEFGAAYGGANANSPLTTAIVTQMYYNVLQRAPDAAGLNFWLNSGVKTGQLLQYFAQSPEFTTNTDPHIHAYQTFEIAGTEPNSAPYPSLFTMELGHTYTMTTGVDTIPSAPDFLPDPMPAGSVVNGFVNVANNSSTFQTGDVIQGSADTTVNIRDISTSNTGPIAAELSNISLINHNMSASNTYDESAYTAVVQEWINSDVSAAGGNTLEVLNAHASTTYGIRTNNVNHLDIHYVAADKGGTSQIALGGTECGSTVTIDGGAAMAAVSFLTTGNNDIGFVGGAKVKTLTVTGDGQNEIEASHKGDVATDGLTIDTSAATGHNDIDLGENFNSKVTVNGNGNTQIGVEFNTTIMMENAWTGVNVLEVMAGSDGNLFFKKGTTGLTEIQVNTDNRKDIELNNIVINNLTGVNSLVFEGDGTDGNQEFSTIWLNGDKTDTLDITFKNAADCVTGEVKALDPTSDVTIGWWKGHGNHIKTGDDGIVADGAVNVTLDTTGLVGSEGVFILGGGFTDNAVETFVFKSNAAKNYLDVIDGRKKGTLQSFDASGATGDLVVEFEEGTFANGALLIGAEGTNHIQVEESGKPENMPVTVFVELGNGGVATNEWHNWHGDKGNWDAWKLLERPSEIKDHEFNTWQIFDARESDDNFHLTVGNGDNLLFLGCGSDVVSVGSGNNYIQFGGNEHDINGGVETLTLAKHPNGIDRILVRNSQESTLDITGLNAGKAAAAVGSDEVYLLLNNSKGHTTVNLGDHPGAVIYANLDNSCEKAVVNLNELNGDILNIFSEACKNDSLEKTTFHLDHTQGGVAGAGAAATINIYDVDSDTCTLKLFFTGLEGDHFNINYNGKFADAATVNTIVNLGAHTEGSQIDIYDNGCEFTAVQDFISNDTFGIHTGKGTAIVLEGFDASQVAHVTIDGVKSGPHGIYNADTELYLDTGNSVVLTQNVAGAMNAIITYGVDSPLNWSSNTPDLWEEGAFVLNTNPKVPFNGIQSVDLGAHNNVFDNIVLSVNGNVFGPTMDFVSAKNASAADFLSFEFQSTAAVNFSQATFSSIGQFVGWVEHTLFPIPAAAASAAYSWFDGTNTWVAQTGNNTDGQTTVVQLTGQHSLNNAEIINGGYTIGLAA